MLRQKKKSISVKWISIFANIQEYLLYWFPPLRIAF